MRAVVQLVSEEGGGVGGEQARERPARGQPTPVFGGYGISASDSRGSSQGLRATQHGASQQSRNGSGGGGGGGGGGTSGCRVTVGNIPRGQANPEDLAEICRAAGSVISASIRVTKSKQYEGIVMMGSSSDADMAVELLNGADCNGRALRVRKQ